MKLQFVLLTTVFLILNTSCGDDKSSGSENNGDDALPVVTTQEIQTKVFDEFCIKCHKAGGKLDLSSSEAYLNNKGLFGDKKLPLVTLGDASRSAIFVAMASGSMPKAPRGGGPAPKVSEELIEKVRLWINGL